MELQSHISSLWLGSMYPGWPEPNLFSWGQVCVCRIAPVYAYMYAKGRAVIISLSRHWKKKDTASFGCSSAKLGKWRFFFFFLSSLNCCFCKRAERGSFLWCCQWPLCPVESEQHCVEAEWQSLDTLHWKSKHTCLWTHCWAHDSFFLCPPSFLQTDIHPIFINIHVIYDDVDLS